MISEIQKLKSLPEVLGGFLHPTDAMFQIYKRKRYQQDLRDGAGTSRQSGFN